MFFIIAMLFTIASTPEDLIASATENYGNVETYRVTLRSNKEDTSEIIRYYYKKPGYVRMEFIKPHKGAVLVYNPEAKKVRLRPFGFLKPFVLTLSPDNSLLKSSNGHTVDESDIGALLEVVIKLQSHGKSDELGDVEVRGKTAVIVSVEGKGDFTVDNDIHRYHLWLDKETFLPLKVSAYDLKGELIEEVLMDDLELNVEFEESSFEL
jgi:outer membrane lipoprotein-sorting protein